MTDWIAFGIVCVKKLAMFWPRLVTNETTDCHAEERNEVNEAHALRPVSVCVKNQTSAATSAPIAVTTRTIGFAFIAALRTHCPAAAIFAAASNDFNAVTAADMRLAVLNAAKPPAMPAMMVRIASPLPIAQSPSDCNVDASFSTNGAAALNASPTSWPMEAATPPF